MKPKHVGLNMYLEALIAAPLLPKSAETAVVVDRVRDYTHNLSS